MSTTTLAIGAMFLVLAAATGIGLLHQWRRELQIAARVTLARGGAPTVRERNDGDALRFWLARTVGGVGQLILRSRLLPSGTLADLERTLESSGLRGANGVALFIGVKILLFVGLPIVAVVALNGVDLPYPLPFLLPCMAAVIGLLAPDWVIGKQRKRVMARLEQGLPDALDMMVICAQAGLGLGPTIIRVGTELAPARPEFAHEFLLTANDLQIMSDSRVALGNLAKRTGLDSVKRLVTALIQTMVYGTPLTEALRALSVEMRHEMLMRFEARAARLPVLLTLPAILFILPCVFLIVGGPAAIQVYHAMHTG